VQLGIFAKTFARPTVEEVFDAVAGHGLRCVQFNFACAGLPSLPDQVEAALLDRVRKAAAERRIALAAVSATFNMIHPDPKQRRAGRRQLDVIAGTCSRLDTRLVTLCTGTRDPEDMWRRHPDNDSLAAWRDLRVGLNKALTTADKHDITLGIEPETANVIDSARKARRILDELKSPRLKIILDPANLFRRGDLPRMREVLDEAFDLLGGDIVLAHAKELGGDGHAVHRALGTGLLDWEHYLALLQQAHFSGPIIMHGFTEKDVAASTAFLRPALEKTACDH
jgi:sugar phosphate isomerase/epimerase